MNLDYSVKNIPPQTRYGKYTSILREFLDSGKPVAQVTLDNGQKLVTARCAIDLACKRIGGARVVQRNNELFLVRDDVDASVAP